MPNKIFENTVKEIVQDDLDLKTALSIGEPIVAGLPRTPIDNETEVVRSCTQSDSADTFNFSSVSLNEMVDDALHTAKGVGEFHNNKKQLRSYCFSLRTCFAG